MRPFRSALLCRFVAAALAIALGAPLAPAASASPALAMLDDDAAFELALAAAHAADADPVAAFAEAYAAAVDGVSAEAVAHLLGAPSLSGVPTVPPTEALAKAPPAPTPSPASAGVPSAQRTPLADAAPTGAVAVDLPTPPRAPSLRPRAP